MSQNKVKEIVKFRKQKNNVYNLIENIYNNKMKKTLLKNKLMINKMA